VALEEPKLHEFFNRPLSTLELAGPTLVSPTDRLADVIATMRQRRDSCALIAEGGRLRGIITERDVLCKFMEPDVSWDQPVQAMMTPEPLHLDCNEPIGAAVRLMNEHDFRTVPIVEGGTVRGLVRLGDLLRHLAELFPEEVLNIPPRPDQAMPKQEGG
jgi:CBS domain-containing protein